MAVTIEQVAYECAAKFSNQSNNDLATVAADFAVWIAANDGGANAEDAYAALRAAAIRNDSYVPAATVLADADVILAAIIA
jgi:hypothetical protein